MARLFLTYNNQVIGNHLIVAGRTITIGRDLSNSISIDHKAISQYHAKIVHDDRGLHLSDLGSTNGTLVNDDRVMSCQLAHQDWVVIGKHIIVVDLYETLSLEAATQMLNSESSAVSDAEGTILLDVDPIQSKTYVQRLDYLSFMSEKIADFELTNRPVYIGKNKDADILVKGLLTPFSGEPAARIEKHGGDYYLEFVSGMLRPRVNNRPIRKPTKLYHQDVIKIGALRMQLLRTEMTLSSQA